jgi:hypothetical protein
MTMSFEWPQFEDKQPLDGGRSWTARFDSYDQHRENCYYGVRIYDGDQWVAEFMVEIGTEFAGEDWSGPEFLNELRARIARVAVTGKTNTEYEGYLTR